MSLLPFTRHASPVTHSSGHPLVRLAALAIETYIRDQRIIEPPAPLFDEVPEARRPTGVFVCLKHEGRLRGCIGTTDPLYETTAMEVIRNAVAAATRDPRFPAIQETELDRLQIAVDILHPSEAVADEAQLDPRRFGVILQSGRKRAVLLPDLEGIVTVAAQLAAVRAKAGLEPDEPVELRRFEVTRYQ